MGLGDRAVRRTLTWVLRHTATWCRRGEAHTLDSTDLIELSLGVSVDGSAVKLVVASVDADFKSCAAVDDVDEL